MTRVRMVTVKGRRVLWGGVKVSVLPNKKYRDTIARLVKMCGDLTVTIQREVVEEIQP